MTLSWMLSLILKGQHIDTDPSSSYVEPRNLERDLRRRGRGYFVVMYVCNPTENVE